MNVLTLFCFSVVCSELFSPDNLSVYLGILFLLSDFLRHAVWDVNHREYFSQTLCHHKMGTCSNWVVFTDQQIHPYSLSLKVKCPFMKGKKLIDSSFHSWFFFFWTVHIWYKVLNYTCYIFSPFSLFHCFSHGARNFTFTSETSPILLLPKSFLSNATKTISRENCGTQTRRTFADGTRGDVQLERFILLLVPISQQLSWNDRWNVTALFVDNNPAVLNICFSWKLKIIPLQVTSYRAPFMQFLP